ncbi:MAG: Mini-ribonuclease 3 [Oscillospiraceae bacterium]|nr:Mini-ribonuclease 3 [Oscillospiraceae bacterium]
MDLRNEHVLQAQEAMMLNPLQLAYLGDAVWETMIRSELIRRHLNVRHMHQECVKYVNAKSQAKTLEKLYDFLSPEEQDLVRRGKNAHAHHPAPRNQGIENYTAATGFESLIGYLYLTGQDDRLGEIFKVCIADEHAADMQ